MSSTTSSKNGNVIQINNFSKNDNLQLSYKYWKMKGDILLIIGSNYDKESNKINSKTTGKEFGTMFNLNNGHLVYYKNSYDPKKESEIKLSNNKISLANYYLMDGNPENDKLIVNLLIEVINNQESSNLNRFIAKLTIGQIYLIEMNFPKAKSVLKQAENEIKLFEGSKELSIVNNIYMEFDKEIKIMQKLSR